MRRLSVRRIILALLSGAMAMPIGFPHIRAMSGHWVRQAEYDRTTREIALRVSPMVAQMYDVMTVTAGQLNTAVVGIHQEEAAALRQWPTGPNLADVKERILKRLPPGTECDVAVIDGSCRILGTTYRLEQGLDMSGFPDVVLLLKRARETRRVQTEFPVQESTGEHMRFYSYSMIEGTSQYLQLAYWTEGTQRAYRRLMDSLAERGDLAQVSVYMLLGGDDGLTAPSAVFDLLRAAFCPELPADKIQLLRRVAATGQPAVRRAADRGGRVAEYFRTVAVAPGTSDLHVCAVVCVAVDETSHHRMLLVLVGLTGLLTVVAAAAWLWMYRFLNRWLVKPLSTLAEQIRTSVPADLSGPVSRTAELAAMATSYNEHLSRIRAQQVELRTLYQQTEQMVWERTKELQQTNRELALSEEQLKQLSAKLLTLQDDERRRIAADLHDSLGQSLCAVKMRLEGLEAGKEAGDPAETTRGLAVCRGMVEAMIAEVRQIVSKLRPSVLDLHGLEHALEWLYEQYATGSDIRVERRIQPVGERVPASLLTPVFRIAQEAMNNAFRHSGARRVVLEMGIRRDGRLRLAVSDDGKGFDLGRYSSPTGHSFGLLTMRERAHVGGGELTIVSAAGKGTTVEAVWPLPERPVRAR